MEQASACLWIDPSITGKNVCARCKSIEKFRQCDGCNWYRRLQPANRPPKGGGTTGLLEFCKSFGFACAFEQSKPPPTMSPAEHRKAGELFEQLRELPSGELPAALDAACAGDATLRAEISRLLEADRSAGSFLERRAIEDAAELLRRGPVAPGMKLGPFEITAMLGAGGMGEVYRALDTKLDREVAIKVLSS